ncbi:hypothetical protein AKJ16_DCAP16009 [Drosera capensis]
MIYLDYVGFDRWCHKARLGLYRTKVICDSDMIYERYATSVLLNVLTAFGTK